MSIPVALKNVCQCVAVCCRMLQRMTMKNDYEECVSEASPSALSKNTSPTW